MHEQSAALISSDSTQTVDLRELSARELGAAVTPLFILDHRHQHAALNELVRLAQWAIDSGAPRG